MFLSKVKIAVIVLFVLGLVGSGAGLVAHRGKAEQPPPKPVSSPKQPKSVREVEVPPIPTEKEPEIKPRLAKTPQERAALLKARVEAAAKAYLGEWEGISQTRKFGNVLTFNSKPENIYLWSVRWLQAERALKPKHEDQVAALEAHFKRMAKLQKIVKRLSEDLIQRFNLDKAEWYLLEAELWLAEAKAAK